MKIVLVSHSGIGNLIHTTPCLKALRSRYPYAEITLLTWPRSARILEGWGVANVSCEHPATFCQRERPDYVLLAPTGAIWQPNWDHTALKVLRLSPGKIWLKHEVEYLMDFAYNLGYKEQIPKSEIHLDKTNKVVALTHMDQWGIKPKQFICINIGYLKTEHWPLKHWGNTNYSKLLGNYLYPYFVEGQGIVFIGNADDRKDAEEIIKNKPFSTSTYDNFPSIINACGVFNDIKDTAALISQSQLVVGNDGGLMHVASAVGVPTVTIFTFTNPVKNRPFHKKGQIVMVPCDKRMECQHGKFSRCKPNGCLDVLVEDVFKAVKDTLN